MFLKFHSSGLKLSITQLEIKQLGFFFNNFGVILHFLRLFDNLVLFSDEILTKRECTGQRMLK